MLSRLINKKLEQEAYDELKRNIIENYLKPGDKLSAEKISKQLGISRTPVVSAFKTLKQEGYLEILPQHGTFVRQITRDEIKAIYDFREIIEGLVVRLNVKKCDKKKLKKYKDQYQFYLEMNEFSEKDILEIFHLEIEFHDFLVSNCPDIIRTEIQNIVDLTKRSRKLMLEYEAYDKLTDDIKEKDLLIHIKLIQAILEENEELAEQYARQDIRETKYEVLKNNNI